MDYLEIKKLHGELTKQVSLKFNNKDVTTLTWQDYLLYFLDLHDLIYLPQEYNPDFSDILMGKTVAKHAKAVISVNEKMPPNRVHFTTVHELGHFYLHILLGDRPTQNFNSLSNSDSSDDPEEKEANLFASLCLVNEQAFLHAVSNEWSWNKISHVFGVSSTALYYRFKYFLMEDNSFTEEIAVKALRSYESGNTGPLRTIALDNILQI